MRKFALTVLTVLCLALASCSTAYQPTEQQQQQVEHQVKFIISLEQPEMMTLKDASTGDNILQVYGYVLTADGLEGEYVLDYNYHIGYGEYQASQTFDIEPGQTYVYQFRKVYDVPGKPSLGWRFVREEN